MADRNRLVEVVDRRLARWASALPDGERAAVDAALARGVSRVSLPGLLALLALGRAEAAPVTGPRESLVALTTGQVLGQVGRLGGLPVKPEEAADALALLRSGEFFEDVSVGLAAALRFTRGLPASVIRDVTRLPELPGEIVSAVRADVGDVEEGAIRRLLQRLAGTPSPPAADAPLEHTMRALLAIGTLRSCVETLRGLLDPENRTFRLAIIVYLRSLGLGDFGEAELDTLRLALDPDMPDLEPLVDAGLARLHARAGAARGVLDALAAMGIR
jgi:hypothetical protein